jgi:hypothetical protein
MNGRLYDPVLSRFIQADPIIQSPYDGQSLNRYTYVWNNPLAFTDPSGYTAKPKWLQAATTVLAIYVAVQTGFTASNMLSVGGSSIVGAASCTPYTMGHVMLAVAGGGAASGTIASGSPKGALSGAVTSLAYFGAGQLATTLEVGLAGRSAIHGVTGGVLDELQGGSFGHGFINAGVNKYLSTSLMTEHLGTDALIGALVGGTMSEATGGDFASGALSSAMQFAMNACIQGLCDSNLEQTLYDWMPGYKFGTWVGNRVTGRDMGTWTEAGQGLVDMIPQGGAGRRALSALDDASRLVRFKRWARGDAIDKPMPDGSAPDWDVVRSRYWKNRSHSASPREFSQANLERMRRGSAPLDYNARTRQWESRELHHVDPQRNGGSHGPFNLREVTPDQHRALDRYRR